MARCGCNDTCNCLITAGTNTTVSGVGSVADPYVVSADDPPTIVSATAGNLITDDDGAFLDCETIQDCIGEALTGVDGIVYDDAGNAIGVNLVDSDGNPLTPTADGTYQLPAAPAETVTTLVDNGDGSLTYTNEDGVAQNFAETATTLVNNGDGTFTYTNESGDTTAFGGAPETITTLVGNGDGTFTYTNESGATTVFSGAPETVTNLAQINCGLQYTNESGAVQAYAPPGSIFQRSSFPNTFWTAVNQSQINTATLANPFPCQATVMYFVIASTFNVLFNGAGTATVNMDAPAFAGATGDTFYGLAGYNATTQIGAGGSPQAIDLTIPPMIGTGVIAAGGTASASVRYRVNQFINANFIALESAQILIMMSPLNTI